MSAQPAPPDPFGAAFEIHPDPALLVAAGDIDDTASRRVLAANRAARDLLRIPAEGAPLVHAMRDPEVLEAVDESLFGGMVGTATWVSGGVTERVWRAHSRPVGDGGDSRLALLVLHDETDARLAERTRADFMANASHELRTPLASLAGFIETLRGHAREDPEARERFLMIMADQTQRMSRLVEDLLSLSRIELNEHVPPSGLVDLAATIVDVAEALAPLAREGGVALKTKLPAPRSAWVAGDRDQILQVVQNLVDNALKYSPEGGEVVIEATPGFTPETLAAERMEGAARIPLLTPDRTVDQRYVAIRVSDQGPGMEREHLPRLAERFYRVGGQKSGARPGTGLGLAIVKHVVNRHRGGLAVESAPGAGSAFTAYFPVSGEARRRQPADVG